MARDEEVEFLEWGASHEGRFPRRKGPLRTTSGLKRQYNPERARDQALMFGSDNIDLGTPWCQSAMNRDPDHEIALRVYRQIKAEPNQQASTGE